MSKDFTDVAFNHMLLKKELDQFRELMNSKSILGEREIQEQFKASRHQRRVARSEVLRRA